MHLQIPGHLKTSVSVGQACSFHRVWRTIDMHPQYMNTVYAHCSPQTKSTTEARAKYIPSYSCVGQGLSSATSKVKSTPDQPDQQGTNLF